MMVCLIFFSGCEQEKFESSSSTQENTNHYHQTSARQTSELDNYYLKKTFALALHQAMTQNAELREFP